MAPSPDLLEPLAREARARLGPAARGLDEPIPPIGGEGGARAAEDPTVDK
jgi:hypothetical protein